VSSNPRLPPGNTKGGSITVLLASCLTGLESAVWQLTIFVFICKTDQSKPIKQEVNGTVILPPFVFPAPTLAHRIGLGWKWQTATGIIQIVKRFTVQTQVWVAIWRNGKLPNPFIATHHDVMSLHFGLFLYQFFAVQF
jgi:hypothetical protein